MQYTFHYHSNGSFLLTGEYLVSQGSQAIVLPLKKGQTLVIKPIKEDLLIWEDIYNEETLFKAVFSTGPIDIMESSDGEEALFVRTVIRTAMDHLASLTSLPGYAIQSVHNYPARMDPGSRPALIASVAEWFNINPFRLNREITQDAGYGIAGARSSRPILYQMVDNSAEYEQIALASSCTENMYFVYAGDLEDLSGRREKIEHAGNLSQIIPKIREINKNIIQSGSLQEFENALLDYEHLLSGVMEEKTIQQRLFDDFPGVIKPMVSNNSIFLLVTWQGTREELTKYFARHNWSTLFHWSELIISGK